MAVNPPEGYHTVTIRDSAGCSWGIATHIEDVTEEQNAERIQALGLGAES